MAITRAPLLSFGASGQLGKSIVYSTWKGQKYARQYVIPANPNTVAQQAQRNLFKWVHDFYKYMDANATSAWVAYAKGKTMTGPNAWTTKNLTALKGQVVITPIVYIPAVLGGPPNAGNTVTPGVTQLTVLSVPPALPAGWAITEMITVIAKQQIPSGEEEPNPSITMTKLVAPWSLVFTGLTTGTVYVCGTGWKMTRADGSIAYGGSTNTLGTPT